MSRVVGRTAGTIVWLLILGAAHTICGGEGPGRRGDGGGERLSAVTIDGGPAQGDTTTMDQQFADALSEPGPEYLRAEAAFRDGGAPAASALRGHLADSDPVARLLARCLLDWNEGRAPDYRAAVDYLEGLPARFARTPVKAPPAAGVAAELEERYGDRVAGILALRLWKQADTWADWQVGAVLFYLQDHAPPEMTPVLIRFAAETRSDRYRRAAVEVLKNIKDPDLNAKVAEERRRFARQGNDFPDEVEALESYTPSP